MVETGGQIGLSARLAGYSAKTSDQAGSRLYADPEIKAAIDGKLAERHKARAKEIIKAAGKFKDKDHWLAELIALYDATLPDSPRKERLLELIGKAMGHLTPPEPSNHLQLNIFGGLSPAEMVSRARNIAEKLYSPRVISEIKPIESSEVIAP
jgi:hypothetical protein